MRVLAEGRTAHGIQQHFNGVLKKEMGVEAPPQLVSGCGGGGCGRVGCGRVWLGQGAQSHCLTPFFVRRG